MKQTPVVERERAQVAYGVAMMQASGQLHGRPEIEHAANSDGHIVVLPFAPTELAADALVKMNDSGCEYVIIATRVDGSTQAWVMKRSDGALPRLEVGGAITVAEWFQQMLSRRGEVSYGTSNVWLSLAVSA